MGKIIICGDSFMAPSTETTGCHFSEIVARALGCDLEIYSRGGMSNAGIAVQLESAIAQRPDLILVNTTGIERIEIPLVPIAGDEFEKNYNGDITIENIPYRHGQSLSSMLPERNLKPFLISDTIQSLLPDYPFVQYEGYIPNIEKIKEAVEFWFLNLYDHRWKYKLDMWTLYAVYHKLHMSGIPYLVVLSWQDMKNHCSWLNDENYLDGRNTFVEIANARIEKYNKENTVQFRDPGYHTLPEDQEVLALRVLENLKKYSKI